MFYRHRKSTADHISGSATASVSLLVLARAHQSLKFINQDLTRMITRAEAGIPEELRSRTSFMPYDFFTPQPVRGADVYLFHWIFHGWGDGHGVRILRSQIPALKKGARILINEWCLPEPSGVSGWDEGIMRTMDLLMLMVVNSNERDLDMWRELFNKADPNFAFLGASQPEGCRMWTIETVWDRGKEFSEKDALPGALF